MRYSWLLGLAFALFLLLAGCDEFTQPLDTLSDADNDGISNSRDPDDDNDGVLDVDDVFPFDPLRS